MQSPMLEDVIRRLYLWKGHWRGIESAAGVPYDTIAKIAQRKTKNPGINTVTKLHTYLITLGEPPTAASDVAALERQHVAQGARRGQMA